MFLAHRAHLFDCIDEIALSDDVVGDSFPEGFLRETGLEEMDC